MSTGVKSLLGACFVGLALSVPAEAGHRSKRNAGYAPAATTGEFAPMTGLSAGGDTSMLGAMGVLEGAMGPMASPQASPQMVPKQVTTYHTKLPGSLSLRWRHHLHGG
jgi:hypothetical protein